MTRTVERSPAQLDPAAAYAGFHLAVGFSILAVGYAVFSSVAHAGEITRPAAAVVGLVLVAMAAAVLIVAARPEFAPVGRWVHAIVMILTVLGAFAYATSIWGHNAVIQDDWGPISAAMLITTMALLRPSGEVVVSGVIVGGVLGVLAVVQTPFVRLDENPLVYFIVAATPVIAFAIAAAAYSRTMTVALVDWQSTAMSALEHQEAEVRETTARSVHQDKVTLVNARALPLLQAVLATGQITAKQVQVARSAAAQLRDYAVASLERTWLDDVVAAAQIAGDVQRGASDVVDRTEVDEPGDLDSLSVPADETPHAHTQAEDPDRLATSMPAHVRAVLSEAIATLPRLNGFDPRSLHVTVDGSETTRVDVEILATVHETSRHIRGRLLPLVSVMRTIGRSAVLKTDQTHVAIRFSYDR